MLLQFPYARERYEVLLRATLAHLLSGQHADGNFGACAEDASSSLVHWCHGAPGFIYLLCEAYAVWGSDEYLQAAERVPLCITLCISILRKLTAVVKCADLVWEKGLLRKGERERWCMRSGCLDVRRAWALPRDFRECVLLSSDASRDQ